MLIAGVALYFIGLSDEGFGKKDLKDTGRTIVIIASVLIATDRRTAREDKAFRSGYDMGRNERAKKHDALRVLPFQRSRGVSADDEATHVEVSRDRGA